MKAFFQDNWKEQLSIDFFTRLTNFKWLWKVNSQAFSNQTFFSILMGFQLIKISWKTCARCWHLVLPVPNEKYFFAKICHFDDFLVTLFRVSRNKKAEFATSKLIEISNRLDFSYIFVLYTLPCLHSIFQQSNYCLHTRGLAYLRVYCIDNIDGCALL